MKIESKRGVEQALNASNFSVLTDKQLHELYEESMSLISDLTRSDLETICENLEEIPKELERRAKHRKGHEPE